jgi:predicted MFS family arabinose efflux permease
MISEESPTPRGVRTASALAGVVVMVSAMTMYGIAPLLYGGLVEEGRLDLRQIGLAMTIQALVMGIVNLAADAVLKRKRQRLLIALCVATLVPLQLLYTRQSGTGVLLLSAICSVPQGLLLWTGMGVIARSAGPARLMAYSEISITLLKLAVSSLLAAVLLPRWGINAAFVTTAVVVSTGFFASFLIPSDMHDAPDGKQRDSARMPARGWLALAVVMLVWAGTMSLLSYLVPLARGAGLDAQAAHGAFVALLAGQIGGGVIAAAVAKRIVYPRALAIGAVIALGAIMAFHLQPPGWLFWATAAAYGFTFALSAPFLMPLLIAADPSRRAAGKFMGAALLGSAVGPLLTSRLVRPAGAEGALYTAGGAVALAVIAVVMLQVPRRTEPVTATS